MKPEAYKTFDYLRSHVIDSLQVEVHEFRHQATGALHYHVSADNPENVFMVGFRTIPEDSAGVAHILEHTVLCGSEKYPVRDPFFLMIRRSLNTFMNAMTSSDWTAYPFASQNLKDFDNLLSVYLDAAFFSRLDPLDFAQEGHRLEFEDGDDGESKLVYKGVVYNEMKGAMSAHSSLLWQTITSYLFPSTTYHFNSGGDPEHITDLTYEQLKGFYQTFYHPSNAVFLTFGNQEPADLQARFETRALHRFDRSPAVHRIPDEKRYYSPLAVEEGYPHPADEPVTGKTHIVMGWLLGHSSDLESALEAELLSELLLANSASPLMQALETTSLGSAPSPLCGLEDSNREMSFLCGIEGSEPAHAQALEALVLGVLNEIAENGVEQQQLEAVLHQLELHQREITGDHYPYGLQLLMSCLPSAVHGGDPLLALDIDPVLARLREKIQDPGYIRGLVRELLLDNPHRVRLTLRPDPGLEERRQAALAERLKRIQAGLSPEAAAGIRDQGEALAKRQEEAPDSSLLPRVGLEDVPHELRIPEGAEKTLAGSQVTRFAQGTNGLVYEEVVVDLPHLADPLLDRLPLFCTVMGDLGCGEASYLEMQKALSATTGGIGARSSIHSAVDDVQQVSGRFLLSGKALKRNHASLADLMCRVFHDVRFDEQERIRELVAQIAARREHGITSNGHVLAMGAASAGISPVAAVAFRSAGLQGIRQIKALSQSLEKRDRIAALSDEFEALHQALLAQPRQYLLVSEAELAEPALDAMGQCWTAPPKPSASRFELPEIRETVTQAWVTATQVNFCAKAYPTVPAGHGDAPALGVLGGYLRNGYLHRVIREQGGAYGGGAAHDAGIGAFRFYSYRDPRLTGTLEDFDDAVRWLLEEKQEASALEEAILGVISQIDKPGSPAGEARSSFHQALSGRTPAHRRRYREAVLQVSLDDLRRVAETYLQPDRASIAVVTHSGCEAEARSLGLSIESL